MKSVTKQDTLDQPLSEYDEQQQAQKSCSVSTKCRSAFSIRSKKSSKSIRDSFEHESLLASFAQQRASRDQHEDNMTKPKPLKGTFKAAIGKLHDSLMSKMEDVATHTRSAPTAGIVGRISKRISSKFHQPQQLPT
jgi:hypothetical protein